jgi:hypothetical protein
MSRINRERRIHLERRRSKVCLKVSGLQKERSENVTGVGQTRDRASWWHSGGRSISKKMRESNLLLAL